MDKRGADPIATDELSGDDEFNLGFDSNSKKQPSADKNGKQQLSTNENNEAFEAELAAAAGNSDDEGPMTLE